MPILLPAVKESTTRRSAEGARESLDSIAIRRIKFDIDSTSANSLNRIPMEHRGINSHPRPIA